MKIWFSGFSARSEFSQYNFYMFHFPLFPKPIPDDDDDEDYTPLRLPGSSTNRNANAAPWAGMTGVAAPKVENSFTPMGRGLSIGMEGNSMRLVMDYRRRDMIFDDN